LFGIIVSHRGAEDAEDFYFGDALFNCHAFQGVVSGQENKRALAQNKKMWFNSTGFSRIFVWAKAHYF
jgi:hypothetical protein